MRSCHGGKQVRRERGNAAFARQVVADKSDLANFRDFFLETFPSIKPQVPINGLGRLQVDQVEAGAPAGAVNYLGHYGIDAGIHHQPGPPRIGRRQDRPG